jgi:hypothetical protein
VPSSPDGTIKLARGNAGATTQDVLNISNTGVVSFPQGFATSSITANVTGNLTGDVFASNGTNIVLQNGTNGTDATFTGSVSGGTLSGNASSATALATGSTAARSLANRFGDVVNAKDFGAIGDGVADDTAAIQAAIDVQKGPVFLPNGIYLVSSEIVIKDGTGIIGENPFWKRRTGYVYTGDKNTVIKYVGAGGTNSCVIRASKKAVGVVGTNFGPTGDDLINIQLMNFHIDSNGLAEYGCYMYRAGNCGND